MFLGVSRALSPFFTFCAPGIVFDGNEGIGSHYHVLRARTHFRRYRGRRIPFSCFVLTNSILAVPSASGPVFMFSAPRLVFDGTEGVGSLFRVLRPLTRFRRCRVCRVHFSCFARSDSFLADRGRRVPFSCFPLPGMFLRVPRASSRFFTFCAS
jgi:hypothetical protein